jgi:esterase/lipase
MKKGTMKIMAEGKEIVSLVYSPKGKTKGIVLFCHGFPGNNRLDKLKEKLNKKGFSLIEINYQGDKLSEGKFSFFNAIKDIETTAKKTRRENKGIYFCGLGYSAGGLYIANVARNNPKLFSKIVFLSPVIDSRFFSESPLMEELWQDAKKIIKLESNEYYKKEVDLMNKSHNPVYFASEIRIPVELVQSEKDEVVPIKPVEEFYSKLNCKKKLTWIKNAGHNLKGNEKELIDAILKEE